MYEGDEYLDDDMPSTLREMLRNGSNQDFTEELKHHRGNTLTPRTMQAAMDSFLSHMGPYNSGSMDFTKPPSNVDDTR